MKLDSDQPANLGFSGGERLFWGKCQKLASTKNPPAFDFLAFILHLFFFCFLIKILYNFIKITYLRIIINI